MPVSELQLETWAKQGKTGQFIDTYNSIRGNLLDSSAPYPVKDCEVFLQGSYCNDTNVWADSDVDIVLKHNSAFYYDISGMSEKEQQAFKAVVSTDAQYGYTQFEADAETWIKRLYNGVQVGKKAVLIPGYNNRRNADVLIAQQFRHYHSYAPGLHGYHEGVAFYANGQRIENYPKQHSENCTRKHKDTKQYFKPLVRILKNMRNRMVNDKLIKDGLAPSYFIEGLLYNVPDDKFGTNYQNSFVNAINWILEADRSNFVCANRLYYLLCEDSPVTWRDAKCTAFLNALCQFWKYG